MDDNNKIKSLFIMFPITSTYVRRYDGESKRMNFFIKDYDLLKKCDIWNKVSNSFKK